MTSQTYRFPLPPHPIAAEQARIMTRHALAEWAMNGIADNALLITAELVTNAMKIGDVFHFTLVRQNGGVLVEVSDSSEAIPDPQQRSLTRVDGRGLLLVEACSTAWGWRLEDHGGKTVWALCAERDSAAAGDGECPGGQPDLQRQPGVRRGAVRECE